MFRKQIVLLAVASLVFTGCSQPLNHSAIGSDSAAGNAARIYMEGHWPEELEIDPAVHLSTIRVPAQASCAMLDVSGLAFVVHGGSPRVDVTFQFRDGKTASGALFEMTLFDKNKKALSTRRDLELRNRELPEVFAGAAMMGGDDAPNRSGQAVLRFPTVSPADIDSYRLVVSEPDVARLIQLLDEEEDYPRESAIRALGQLGSVAQPAVSRLTPFLDAPERRLRDTARQALRRIRAGSTRPAAGPARPHLSQPETTEESTAGTPGKMTIADSSGTSR
jgi:hypothetical protein